MSHFITPSELDNVIYAHVMDDISAHDTGSVESSIDAAVDEVKSYLSSRYDVATIFSKTGTERNALVMEQVKTIAVWNLIRLSNSELIYQQWRERYDRVIEYLKQVADGSITPDLPLITDTDGKPVIRQRFGSNEKFQHNY